MAGNMDTVTSLGSAEQAVVSVRCRIEATKDKGDTMAHISLPEGLPGIRGLFAFRRQTALRACSCLASCARQSLHGRTRTDRYIRVVSKRLLLLPYEPWRDSCDS